MLSVVDVLEIVDEAETLAAHRQFGNLVTLLAEVPEDYVKADATLGYLAAFANYMTGREVASHRALVELHAQFIGDKDSRLYRRIVNLRGIVEVELGNLLEAERLLARVQSSAEVAGDQRYIGYATLNRGIISEINGFSERAITAFERARLAFQKLGDQAAIAGCAHNIGMAYRRLTNFSAAESQFTIALDYFEKNGSKEELLASSLERALVLAMRGELQLAESTARIALEWSEEMDNERLVGEAVRVLGCTALRSHDLTTARSMLKRALAIARSGQLRLLQAEVLIELGTVERMDGQIEESEVLLEQAARTFSGMGAVRRAAQILGGLA